MKPPEKEVFYWMNRGCSFIYKLRAVGEVSFVVYTLEMIDRMKYSPILID